MKYGNFVNFWERYQLIPSVISAVWITFWPPKRISTGLSPSSTTETNKTTLLGTIWKKNY